MERTYSRTRNTIFNAAANLGNNLIKVLLKFISRYVFIYTLGQQYLGVSALFSSIITMLSLADLGFSIALPQALYKPLAEKDENRVCTIMNFYSKVYCIIAICIVVIGILLLPVMKVLIAAKDTTGISDIEIIYVLFILQSAVSYLFIYKRTLFTADQKHYYITAVETVSTIILTVAQIAILLLTRNYLLYLSSSIAAIILQNLYISHQCDKRYPYLRNIRCAQKMSGDETKVLSKKIYALFIYKAAIAVETGTDNLVMTGICGLVITGLCSNYTLISTSLAGILGMVMSAATASIGNVIVTENKQNTYKIYSLLDFIGFWVYGVCGICLAVLINPFVDTWLGDQFVLDIIPIAVLCVNFYICGVQNVNSTFRNAFGLFYEGRYRPVCMILVNLGASVILARYIGVTGIFIGTLLSRLLTVGTFDPYIVFKHGLNQPLKLYYKSHLLYHITTLATGLIVFAIFQGWHTTGFAMWTVKAVCVFAVVNLIYMLVMHKNENYTEMKHRVGEIIGKVRR